MESVAFVISCYPYLIGAIVACLVLAVVGDELG
jgi:hypothetical protein